MTDSPQAIAEKGEQIYRQKYQADYERRYLGKFVAIDVATGSVFVADSPAEAIVAGQKAQSAGGPFYVIKVGSAGVYRVGFAAGNRHD